jgi:hypothetical protein
VYYRFLSLIKFNTQPLSLSIFTWGDPYLTQCFKSPLLDLGRSFLASFIRFLLKKDGHRCHVGKNIAIPPNGDGGCMRVGLFYPF